MTLLESLKIFWNIRTTTGAKVAPKNFTAWKHNILFKSVFLKHLLVTDREYIPMKVTDIVVLIEISEKPIINNLIEMSHSWTP